MVLTLSRLFSLLDQAHALGCRLDILSPKMRGQTNSLQPVGLSASPDFLMTFFFEQTVFLNTPPLYAYQSYLQFLRRHLVLVLWYNFVAALSDWLPLRPHSPPPPSVEVFSLKLPPPRKPRASPVLN